MPGRSSRAKGKQGLGDALDIGLEAAVGVEVLLGFNLGGELRAEFDFGFVGNQDVAQLAADWWRSRTRGRKMAMSRTMRRVRWSMAVGFLAMGTG